MAYEEYLSTVNPRLLILLTDGLEESVKTINRLIDMIIQLNFDGDAPKNRCFIIVIGYGDNVRELCSGWLRDLYKHPIRYDKVKNKFLDGTGAVVEVEVNIPTFIEHTSNVPSSGNYVEAIKLISDLCEKWAEDYVMSPIVIDCSEKCCTEVASDEIKQLKTIETVDGQVLFFGSYSVHFDVEISLFSKMPDNWRIHYQKLELNEEDYSNGVFNRNNFVTIVSDFTESGGVAFNKF